jgi:DNA polymerase-3 subunit epsilon
MGQMVNLAARVEGIPCATPLEAHVREIRLIGLHKPSFNRRTRHPERVTWLKLTNEPWPRLSLVKRVLDDDADYLGPFRSKRSAEQALDALHEAFPLRQCTVRMAKTPSLSPCVLAEMGRCLSPCDQSVGAATYAETVQAVRDTLRACPSAVIEPLDERMRLLSSQERYEEATRFRDRLAAFLRGAARSQRLHALTRCAEIVAARKEEGEWRVHVIRHGRLAAAGVIPSGADAGLWVTQLSASAETVLPTFGPLPAASAEEAETLLRWLESDGVRLVHVDGDWACPVRGAERHTAAYSPATADLEPFG